MTGRFKSLSAVILLALLGSSFSAPQFFQDFSGADWQSSFVKSTDEKYNGELVTEIPEGWTQPGLKVPEKARFYGYAANVGKPIDPSKGLVLQFELKLADSLTCGGAYLKFLTASSAFDASGLVEDTPYVVMFGPDKCGSTNKVHLIIKHKAPSGEIEEKHLKTPPAVLLDSDTHVYTAILDPNDNTYKVLIDGKEEKAGSLFEDFEPAFNPPEEIDDPEDKKPEDWVDESRIPDPDASKPDDWDEDAPKEIDDASAEKPEGWLDDEPAEIPDPDAEKPEDWDDEEDGEWEPSTIANPKCTDGPGCGLWKRPKIANPAFKGKWSAPFIDNPAYKGIWAPQKIANPNYFLDEQPLTNIGKVGGVALEIWTMDSNYYFSNIVIDNDPSEAETARNTYWAPKRAAEKKINEEKAAKDAEQAKTEETESPVLAFIRHVIDRTFDLPVLSALRGPLQPVLDLIDENSSVAIGAAATIIVIPLFVLIQLIPKSKKTAVQAKKTVEAKKQDVTGADDKPKVATATTTSEVDEDVVEEDGKVIRRRKRRET